MEYKILEDKHHAVLARVVKSHVEEGWRPTGGVSAVRHVPAAGQESFDAAGLRFYQAMTREVPVPDYEKIGEDHLAALAESTRDIVEKAEKRFAERMLSKFGDAPKPPVNDYQWLYNRVMRLENRVGELEKIGVLFCKDCASVNIGERK